MKASLKKNDIGEMLDRLGKAVSDGDLAGISSCYAFPALFISDESSTVIESAEELESMFAKGRDWYTSRGILETRAELESIDEMTDLIAAINVRWPGFDQAGIETFTETSHYIIQASESKPLIRVAMTRTK